jgi:hypothetical protein
MANTSWLIVVFGEVGHNPIRVMTSIGLMGSPSAVRRAFRWGQARREGAQVTSGRPAR